LSFQKGGAPLCIDPSILVREKATSAILVRLWPMPRASRISFHAAELYESLAHAKSFFAKPVKAFALQERFVNAWQWDILIATLNVSILLWTTAPPFHRIVSLRATHFAIDRRSLFDIDIASRKRQQVEDFILNKGRPTWGSKDQGS
jgi:hypothetical protein